jgi:hypothetical protein
VPIVTGSKFEILFQPRTLLNVRAGADARRTAPGMTL